jgi:hypothetical protein
LPMDLCIRLFRLDRRLDLRPVACCPAHDPPGSIGRRI